VVELHDTAPLPQLAERRTGVSVDGGDLVTTTGEGGSEDEAGGPGSDDGDVHGCSSKIQCTESASNIGICQTRSVPVGGGG
jgi:hypothetical protein